MGILFIRDRRVDPPGGEEGNEVHLGLPCGRQKSLIKVILLTFCCSLMGLEARGCGSSGVVARGASLVLSASGGDVTVDAPTLFRTGGVPLLDRDRLLLRLYNYRSINEADKAIFSDFLYHYAFLACFLRHEF